VLDPKIWATLVMQPMAGLKTDTAYALFQATWRYVGTQAKVTAALPVETWAELLLGQSRYVQVDPKTGSKTVVDYNDFKRRTLRTSMDWINKIAALNYTLELKEFYAGKRVARLQFKFVPKKQESLVLPITWPEDVMTALKSVGYSDSETTDLSQVYSLEEIADSLSRLKSADEKLRSKGRRITSKRAFFEGILNNVSAGRKESDQELEELEAQSKSREAQRLAEDRQKRARDAFEQHQHETFKRALFSMEEEPRKALLSEFERSDEFSRAKLLLKDGWGSNKNRGALTILRGWLSKSMPSTLEKMLPGPEDKSLEAWLAWKAEDKF
jgi:hypothetical protein